jgi:hypothetical protein
MQHLAKIMNKAQELQLADFRIGDSDFQRPPGFQNVETILGWVRWGALVVCIVALIAFFGHLAMERQNGGGGQGSMGWLGKILIAIIGIAGAIALITTLANLG